VRFTINPDISEGKYTLMDNKILQQLQELLKSGHNNFSIIEEQIDIDVQFEYFKLSKDLRGNADLDNEQILIEGLKLNNPDLPEDEFKETIVLLAGIESVEAYRFLEKMYSKEDVRMKDWVALALRESKHILESSFLDEKQVLISTGLGGKGLNLRYFIVLIGKRINEFNDTQKKIIKNEIQINLSNNNSELEEILYDKNLALITCLIPLEINIKDQFDLIISHSNEFGNFLEENFIVTNVKKLSIDEIEEFLEKMKNEDSNEDEE